MAFVAGLFLLVDPLYFTLASSAELVVPMVFFALFALLPLAYESRVGPMNSFVIAGLVLGLTLLSEESAIFVIFAILSYLLLAGTGDLKRKVLSCVELGIAAGLVFCVGLELFDELLEREILMVVGCQRGGSYPGKQGAECRLPRQIDA